MKDKILYYNRTKLLQRVKVKFGTFTKFCRVTGFPYKDLRLIQQQEMNDRLTDPELLAKLEDASSTMRKRRDPIDINPEQLKALRAHISRYGVAEFIRDHKQYNPATIKKIMYGEVKRASKTVRQLLIDTGVCTK